MTVIETLCVYRTSCFIFIAGYVWNHSLVFSRKTFLFLISWKALLPKYTWPLCHPSLFPPSRGKSVVAEIVTEQLGIFWLAVLSFLCQPAESGAVVAVARLGKWGWGPCPGTGVGGCRVQGYQQRGEWSWSQSVPWSRPTFIRLRGICWLFGLNSSFVRNLLEKPTGLYGVCSELSITLFRHHTSLPLQARR